MAKASKKPSRQPAADELKLSVDPPEDQKDPTDESAGASPGGAILSTEQDADALLKEDHREVERLFKEFEDSGDSGRKKQLAREICKELIVHAKLEEEIFYPACREKDVEDDVLDKAQVEHDLVKVLVADILSRSPDGPFYDAKLKVLSELVKNHVTEEEKLLLGIFAGARKAGVDMAALGTRLKERKQRLMAGDVDDIEPPPLRALQEQAGAIHRDRREERNMERWNERDERGGYLGSDDDDRRFSRGRYSSSQDDDDNGGRYSRRGYGGRPSGDDRDRGGSQRGAQGESGRFGSGYGRSGGRSGGWSQSGGYEDDSRYGGAGGGGSGGWSGARSGGYSGRTGGFNDDDEYGRGGNRYGESGGYVTGYGGGFGSGAGGGMGGTQDYPRSSRRGGYRGYGSGEYEGSSGRGYGGESGYSRGGYGNYGSSDDDDQSSRGSRSGRGGFTREREEYGRYRGEDDREWSGGRQGGRRGSGPYRDD